VPAPRNVTDPPATQRPGHRTAILAIICISYFMVILDNSIIFTGLPRIEAAMDFSPTGLTWVQDAYTLVFGGLLLLGARAGDIVGRRRMFVIGLVLFGAASFLVGAAQNPGWLIAARAFQGLAPSSLALLTASFADGRERARAVAAYSAVAGIGASLGLVVGGVLADWVSWRAGFFLNVPIGIVMLLAARRYLTTETTGNGGRFDLVGALCATLGMSALVFAIIDAADAGWTAPTTLGAFVLGAALLAGLVITEARAEQPIMPLRLFASRRRSGAYLVRHHPAAGRRRVPTHVRSELRGRPARHRRRATSRVHAGPGHRRRRHAGGHGVAEPGRPRQQLPDRRRAAHGVHRHRARPRLRPPDLRRPGRYRRPRRRRRLRAGQHLSPAR
jgi:Major Facilitator Superfamily